MGQRPGKAGGTHLAQPRCCSARALVELGLGASSCLHHRYPGVCGLSKAAIQGQGPTVETCTALRPACGCRSLPLNEREVTSVMNIFQRGSPLPLVSSKTPRQRGRTLLGNGGTQGASPGNRGCCRPPRPPQQLLPWFYWLLSRSSSLPPKKVCALLYLTALHLHGALRKCFIHPVSLLQKCPSALTILPSFQV